MAAHPAAGHGPARDELLIKVLVAAYAPDVDVHEVIQAHRHWLVELMQRYTSLKADATEEEVALALVVDSELFRLEGAVRWLDTADVRLRRHRPQAPTVAPGGDRRRGAAAGLGLRR